MGLGSLHQNSLEIEFRVVSDRGVIYQLLLVPWTNIVPSRNYCLSVVKDQRPDMN